MHGLLGGWVVGGFSGWMWVVSLRLAQRFGLRSIAKANEHF